MTDFEKNFGDKLDGVDRKFDYLLEHMNTKFDNLLGHMNTKFEQTDGRLSKLEGFSKEANIKLDAIALNLKAIDRNHGKRIANLEHRVDKLENRPNS